MRGIAAIVLCSGGNLHSLSYPDPLFQSTQSGSTASVVLHSALHCVAECCTMFAVIPLIASTKILQGFSRQYELLGVHWWLTHHLISSVLISIVSSALIDSRFKRQTFIYPEELKQVAQVRNIHLQLLVRIYITDTREPYSLLYRLRHLFSFFFLLGLT